MDGKMNSSSFFFFFFLNSEPKGTKLKTNVSDCNDLKKVLTVMKERKREMKQCVYKRKSQWKTERGVKQVSVHVNFIK